MTQILSYLQETLKKRAAYNRTVAELRAMPLDVAIDLDLYPPDADKIARRAVYGEAVLTR